MPPEAEPRFLADCMLGKVARWLVMLGFDARLAPSDSREDAALLEEARREGRVFLTRDTRIPPVAGLRVLVLREQRFEDQLRRVLRETGLTPDPARLFSRCTLCNEALAPLPREEALPRVPEKVRGLRTDFFRCPRCGNVYWAGTHVANTLKKLKGMGL